MRFFVLRPQVGSDAETAYEPVGDVRLGEAPRCPQCGGYTGLKKWLPPYRVRLRTFGKCLGDVAFDVGRDLIVSDRFLNAWRSAGLSDLPADQVEVVARKRNREEIERRTYFHVAAPRTEARLDCRRSKVVRQGLSTCELCGKPGIVNAIRGVYIDESSWKGEDIFVPWGLNGFTVVTERVPMLATKNHLKNVTVMPSEAFYWGP